MNGHEMCEAAIMKDSQLDRCIDSVLQASLAALKAKSLGLYYHTVKTTRVALAISDAIGVSEETRKNIYIGSIFHDIGKLYIKDSILLKPGTLDDQEKEIIQYHTLWGSEFLLNIPVLAESDIPHIVCCHHEKWDGSGYPGSLKANEIPFESMIISVADCFAAMTQERPYKSAYSNHTAIKILQADFNGFFGPSTAMVVQNVLFNDKSQR